ncbi:MAG: molecular chaperone DnaK (HSP70), partial [Pseudoalteromonas tetraodonis]
MFAGLDFGTSNCEIGVWQNGSPRILKLEGDKS